MINKRVFVVKWYHLLIEITIWDSISDEGIML